MRSKVLAILAVVVLPQVPKAQDLPRPEIGIRSGIVRISEGGIFGGTEPSTFVVLPDGVFGSGGGLHFTKFFSPKFALEPQLGLMRLSSDGDTFSITTIGLQPNWFLKPDATRAPYFFLALKTQVQKSAGSGFSSSETRNGVGLGFGFRRVIRESLAMRYEARAVQWSGGGEKATELALLVGVGAVIRK